MSEVQVIHGSCSEITIKGEWTTFAIDIGKQYPVKISTKLPALIASAQAAGSAVMAWGYTESEGAPNPHRPGTNYKNRRLEWVKPADQAAPTQQSGSSSGGGGSSSSGDDGRGRSIERQVIVKSAIALYPAGIIQTDEQFFALLNRLDEFISAPPSAPAVAAAAPAPDPDERPPAEDDIPF